MKSNFYQFERGSSTDIPAVDWLVTILPFWPHLLAGSNFPAALLASIHVLLHKRDSRATTLWLATIWFLPLLGPILYVALGINRIRRRAISLATPGDNREFTLPASSVPTSSFEPARWWASRQ
jgi:cardiolipin synthase